MPSRSRESNELKVADDVARLAEQPNVAVGPHEHDPTRSHAVALAGRAVHVNDIVDASRLSVVDHADRAHRVVRRGARPTEREQRELCPAMGSRSAS